MSDTFPRWVQADGPPFTPSLRVELKPDQFVDYVRLSGVWRQQTCRMTAVESVNPARFMLGDWRAGSERFPEAADMADWLETTYNQIGADR